MKKFLTMGVAMLAALASLGSATVASAARPADFTGVWRLDARHSDLAGWANGGQNDDRRGGRDRDWRGTDHDPDDRYWGGLITRGPRGAQSAGFLPELIQIERSRRALRVENQNGRLLREIQMRRGRWGGDRLTVERTGFGGVRITEVFSLENRGRHLVVRTTVSGVRGAREFTSVYDRA